MKSMYSQDSLSLPKNSLSIGSSNQPSATTQGRRPTLTRNKANIDVEDVSHSPPPVTGGAGGYAHNYNLSTNSQTRMNPQQQQTQQHQQPYNSNQQQHQQQPQLTNQNPMYGQQHNQQLQQYGQHPPQQQQMHSQYDQQHSIQQQHTYDQSHLSQQQQHSQNQQHSSQYQQPPGYQQNQRSQSPYQQTSSQQHQQQLQGAPYQPNSMGNQYSSHQTDNLPNTRMGGFQAPPQLNINPNQPYTGIAHQIGMKSKHQFHKEFNSRLSAQYHHPKDVNFKGYDPKKEKQSYLVTLRMLNNIPKSDPQLEKGKILPNATYKVEYTVTLYNKKEGIFYGKTYRSQAIALKENNQQFWETANEEYIYFNTRFVDKDSVVVIECNLIRQFANDLKNQSSLGFCIANIFDNKPEESIDLQKGSLRIIGQVSSSNMHGATRQQMAKLTFQVHSQYKAFDDLRYLIPDNTLIGIADIIPGLVGEKLPPPRSINPRQTQSALKLLSPSGLYIHNIQVTFPVSLEVRFESFLKKMKAQKYKGVQASRGHNITDAVQIVERRLVISANNTWQNLSEDNQSLKSPNNNQGGGVYTSSGSFHVSNYIAHQLVGLCFRVEYKFDLRDGSSPTNMVIGYCTFMPTLNAANDLANENIDIEFQIGPGETPQGDLIWAPNADDNNYYSIKLKALISNSQTAPDPHTVIQAPIAQRGGGIQQQLIQPTIGGQHDPGNQYKNQIEQLQLKLRDQEQRQFQDQRHVEQGAFRNMQQQPPPHYSDQERDMMKLLQFQNQQLQSQVETMKFEKKGIMDSFQHDPYSQNMSRQYGQSIPYMNNSQQQQISMIGNVFYNMLNMIGENEKDKRIIGLSENIKKMVQTSQFDDLLAPKTPYVGMGAVNLLKTMDLPVQDQINFIKMGYGDILQNPAAQLTSTGYRKEEIQMDIEKMDLLRASTIQFKFICYRTPQHNMEQVPRRLFFQFKFFTFPSIITEKVRIKFNESVDPNQHFNSVQAGHPYYLEVDQNQGMLMRQGNPMDSGVITIRFDVDPSKSRVPDENLSLASYLYDRFLTVDVFDGDSLFHYASCKVPLFEILRQGRSSIVKAKECEMCEPESGDFRGALQLIMSNVGHIQQVIEDPQQMQLMQSHSNSPVKTNPRLQPSQASGKQHKYKKIVKSKPMDLNQQKMQQTYQTNMSTMNMQQPLVDQITYKDAENVQTHNADLRKKLRVDRVRKKALATQQTVNSVDDPHQSDWAKARSLKEIELIRETKKGQILNQVLNEYIGGVRQLPVIPGELAFITIPIQNPFAQKEVFTFNIRDTDEGLSSDAEFKMVTDPHEWRHWVTAEKCPHPASYDIVTKNNDIILQPNEKCMVLFKFQTFRDSVPLQSPVPASAEIIKPHKIEILIMQSNKSPFETIEIQVIPSSAPYDHTFRFYEPQYSYVTVTIPPFLSLNFPNLNAILSKASAVCEISRENHAIFVSTKTEDAPKVTQMLLYVYGDVYKEKPLASCKIEIHAMVTQYQKLRAGVQINLTLQLPADFASIVKLFSTNPKLVYMPGRDLTKAITLVPSQINNLQVCAKSYLAQQQKVRVNCVDVHTGQLVYNWLLILESEKPHVTQTHDVSCFVNSSCVQSLKLENKLNLKATFEIASSRPDYVFPKIETVQFDGKSKNEVKLIDLYFPPQPRMGTAEVYIYASDLYQQHVECFLLKVSYMV